MEAVKQNQIKASTHSESQPQCPLLIRAQVKVNINEDGAIKLSSWHQGNFKGSSFEKKWHP